MRSAMRGAGIEPRRHGEEPFGVHWSADLGHCLKGRPLGVAFDVGAHRGETTLRLLEAFPEAQVHSFEPTPESFAELERATAGTGARVVNAAITERSGPLTIARGEASYQSGVDAPGERIEVRGLTVDDYADEQGLQRIALLKADTEGHEEAVLRGAGRRLAAGEIDFVVCECEFTRRPEEPHGYFPAIHATLEPLGYRVVSFYTGGVDNLGWLWGDVLYMRVTGERDRGQVSLAPRAGAGRRGHGGAGRSG